MPELNGDFETDTSGWGGSGGGSIARQTTTYHTGSASAVVTSAGSDETGATAGLTMSVPQNSTWDISAYLQAHGSGDAGRLAALLVQTNGGTQESALATPTTLTQNGWQLATIRKQFLNAGHTSLVVGVLQSGSGAVMNIDADTIIAARHLSYLPSGDPGETSLWVPGAPAGNFSEPVQAQTAALIASGLYAGA